MMRRLLFAIAIVLGLITLVACDKKNPMTGPTPTTCEDPRATNLGGPLPCKFPPASIILEARSYIVDPGSPGGISMYARAGEAPGKFRTLSTYTPADATGLLVLAFYGGPGDLEGIARDCFSGPPDLLPTAVLCPQQLTLSRESAGTSPKTHYFDDYDGRRVIVVVMNRGSVHIHGTTEVWYDPPGAVQP